MADYETKATKAMDCLEKGLEHALTVLDLPQRYRKRLRTTNLAERMNSELRRRQRVVRVFPDEPSAERLIGALRQELYEQWRQSSHRYFNMSDYWDQKKEKQNHQENNLVTITAS
jgi:transposase-like protein